MSHSYEEIRQAAFDVLGKRIQVNYDPDQYRHFSLGVATALMKASERQTTQSISMFSRDVSLEGDDADTFLEVFWDLFRQGVITLGLNDSNPQFPFFRLTALGNRVVRGEDAYFVHDVSGYEKRINTTPLVLDEGSRRVVHGGSHEQDFYPGVGRGCAEPLGEVRRALCRRFQPPAPACLVRRLPSASSR